jgi:hypothetical protein
LVAVDAEDQLVELKVQQVVHWVVLEEEELVGQQLLTIRISELVLHLATTEVWV